MSSSHKIHHILVVPQNEQTPHFPVKLQIGKQVIITTALIDSKTTGNFINLGLLSHMNFPMQHLSNPLKAYNVDGISNKKGTIHW